MDISEINSWASWCDLIKLTVNFNKELTKRIDYSYITLSIYFLFITIY